MPNRKILVVPVGDGIKSLQPALKALAVRKVHLLSTQENAALAEKTKKELETRGIETRVWKMIGDVWEETFRIIAEITSAEPDVVVHVGTSDRMSQCAATSAAFVNGVNAINGDEHNIMMLPVLKFNYYTQLTEKKMNILRSLDEKQYKSLDELSKKLKMSLPLLSYHIHGNYKTEGLVQMNLVELGVRGSTQAISLTAMARLLLKGYVK